MNKKEVLYDELMKKIRKDYCKVVEIQLENYKQLIMAHLGYSNEQLYEVLTDKEKFNTEKIFEYQCIFNYFKDLIYTHDIILSESKGMYHIDEEELIKMIEYTGNNIYAVYAGFDKLIVNKEDFSDKLEDAFNEFKNGIMVD